MVIYRIDLSDKQKKEVLMDIALEDEGYVRKRRIGVPILMIAGIVITVISLLQIINYPEIIWYIYLVFGVIVILLTLNIKWLQKFALKKAERFLDKSVRNAIVEYHFDVDGVEIISQLGISKNYWTAFKGYGTKGSYIYIKRKDNKLVLIDKNSLSPEELDELTQLLEKNLG